MLPSSYSRALGNPSAAWPRGTDPLCHPTDPKSGARNLLEPALLPASPSAPSLARGAGTGGRQQHQVVPWHGAGQRSQPANCFPASLERAGKPRVKTPETLTKAAVFLTDVHQTPTPAPSPSLESPIKFLPPLPPRLRVRITVPYSEEVNLAPGNYI